MNAVRRKMLSPETISTVRDTANLVGVVEETVALKKAGISWKGLCPFHSESTPSFTVTPDKGFWYCFGCSEGGDVIDFVRKRDGLSFVEAVETLAEKTNIPLQYADGSEVEDHTGVSPRRIMKANEEAARYYRQRWVELPLNHPAKKLLADKHMGDGETEYFGVGWAPNTDDANGGWSKLAEHLLKRNFTKEEIVEAGLASTNDNGGLYDRFRGRIMWPIHNTAGGSVGFGGRRISDDKTAGAKYVNTTDTAAYHKSELLYNLHRARKNAATEKTIVVVEGYTDVMALHASNIGTGVAACGTAFGEKHAMVLKRALGDGIQSGANTQIVFMFDGDEAGIKAALRAEAIGSVFSAETYAVVLPDGQDPCDVYMRQGPDALSRIIEQNKTPLTLFAIDHILTSYDLTTPEGTALALEAAGALLGKTRNMYVRERYREHVGNRLGVPAHLVPVGAAPDSTHTRPAADTGDFLDTPATNPNFAHEEETLLMVIQNPHLAQDWYASVEKNAYTSPLLATMHNIVESSYSELPGLGISDYGIWRETLLNKARTDPNPRLANELSKLLVQEPKVVVEGEKAVEEHVLSTIAQLVDRDAQRRILERRKAAAACADADEQTLILMEIMELEKYRKETAQLLSEELKELSRPPRTGVQAGNGTVPSPIRNMWDAQ